MAGQEGVPLEVWRQLGEAMHSPQWPQLTRERQALAQYLDHWQTAGVGSAFLVEGTAELLNANLGNFIDGIPDPTIDQQGGMSWVAIIDGESGE